MIILNVFWVLGFFSFELLPVYFPQTNFMLKLNQDIILSEHQTVFTWKYTLYQKRETGTFSVAQNDIHPSILLCHLIPAEALDCYLFKFGPFTVLFKGIRVC